MGRLRPWFSRQLERLVRRQLLNRADECFFPSEESVDGGLSINTFFAGKLSHEISNVLLKIDGKIQPEIWPIELASLCVREIVLLLHSVTLRSIVWPRVELLYARR